MSISTNQMIRNAVRRPPCVSLLLTMLAGIIHLSYTLRIQLLFDRTALAHNELWRLLTCHWVHLSTEHLCWSALTFLGLGFLCEILDPKKYYATLILSAILIPAVIWWGLPDLGVYGGLSGLDCALYSLLMILLMKQEIRSCNWTWILFFFFMLGGLIAKITYETVTGQTIFVSTTHTNMIPVPLAHLVGGMTGFVVGTFGDRLSRRLPVLRSQCCARDRTDYNVGRNFSRDAGK